MFNASALIEQRWKHLIHQMDLVEKSLPVMVSSKRLWKKYASQQDAVTPNIYIYIYIYMIKDYSSASKIEAKQYLALRALWKIHSSAGLVPENCGIKGTEKPKSG
uniref:Uncharacterized protein n=1 Tax=Coccidioides posadasii RMSCC 3488 TaxID=454284 RepID=A0A0J6FFP4_COCPO|nr:hypothetical protein CPAG_04487 [Coccidioides posadasii RMSCC 3488]